MIPDSVIIIGKNAFYNCNGINNELCIPKFIDAIGENAFKKTDFSKITYNSQSQPKCHKSIGFMSSQFIFVGKKYDNHYSAHKMQRKKIIIF